MHEHQSFKCNMRTIILTENEHKHIINLMNEEISHISDKVLSIKDYLDNNFAKADNTTSSDGKPINQEIVVWLDKYKQPYKNMTDMQLFYVIQDKFKNIITNKEIRDNFIKQVIRDWYKGSITKDGCLTNYDCLN